MKRLFEAPHRIFFFAAAMQILLASAWWAASIAARAGGSPGTLPAELEPPRVHAFLMIYGFFPLFIFGFLLTAGPRWLARPPTARGEYAAPAIVAVAAAWALLPAFHLGRGAAAFVIVFMLATWGWLLGHFVVQIDASRAPDRLHAILVACTLAVGITGLAAARLWLVAGSEAAARYMEVAGLWGFLVPLFVAVCHRMIPFITAGVGAGRPPWAPAWTLAALTGAAAAHGALVLASLDPWTWLVDGPAAALVVALAVHWDAARCARDRMLAMLHLGFAWLAAGWALHAVQSALRLAGESALGLAPTHAIAIGFLSSLTLAMVSRMSAGRSTRKAAGAGLAWNVFLLLQAAALARVAADVWTGFQSPLLLGAAGLWLACFASWSWRYVPCYWEARVDGQPG